MDRIRAERRLEEKARVARQNAEVRAKKDAAKAKSDEVAAKNAAREAAFRAEQDAKAAAKAAAQAKEQKKNAASDKKKPPPRRRRRERRRRRRLRRGGEKGQAAQGEKELVPGVNAPAPRAPEKVPLAPRLETTKPRDVPAKAPVAKDQPAAAGGAAGEEGSGGKVGKVCEQEGYFFEQEGFEQEGKKSSEQEGSEEEEVVGLVASDAVGVPRALLPRVRVRHRRRVRDSFRRQRRLMGRTPLFCYYQPLVRCIHQPPHVNNIYIRICHCLTHDARARSPRFSQTAQTRQNKQEKICPCQTRKFQQFFCRNPLKFNGN